MSFSGESSSLWERDLDKGRFLILETQLNKRNLIPASRVLNLKDRYRNLIAAALSCPMFTHDDSEGGQSSTISASELVGQLWGGGRLVCVSGKTDGHGSRKLDGILFMDAELRIPIDEGGEVKWIRTDELADRSKVQMVPYERYIQTIAPFRLPEVEGFPDTRENLLEVWGENYGQLWEPSEGIFRLDGGNHVLDYCWEKKRHAGKPGRVLTGNIQDALPNCDRYEYTPIGVIRLLRIFCSEVNTGLSDSAALLKKA